MEALRTPEHKTPLRESSLTGIMNTGWKLLKRCLCCTIDTLFSKDLQSSNKNIYDRVTSVQYLHYVQA